MSYRILAGVVSALLCVALHSTVQAEIWSELGDAGDSLITANKTTGMGTLDAILGTLPYDDNGTIEVISDDGDDPVDLFAIYIDDPSLFSATTANGTDLRDSWLYLFDKQGKGVVAAATSVGGDFHATIGTGSVSDAAAGSVLFGSHQIRGRAA